MNILVTGGAGFIGSHIVDALLARGHRVTVIDDLRTGQKRFVNPRASFLKLDIRSPKVTDVIVQLRPQIIFHCAAQINARYSVVDPIEDAETNVIGFLRVVEAARRARVKKFIFSSTGGALYGGAKTIPTPETYPARPFAPYGVSKLAAEHYLRALGIPHVALRYANVYGPRQNAKSEAGVISIFATKMLRGEKPTIFGNGRQTRDYVYVDDVVQANLLALGRGSGAINIGTGVETDVRTLYKKIARLTGYNKSPRLSSALVGEEQRSVLDARLAKHVLGWSPKMKLDQGLIKTVLWFKHDLH